AARDRRVRAQPRDGILHPHRRGHQRDRRGLHGEPGGVRIPAIPARSASFVTLSAVGGDPGPGGVERLGRMSTRTRILHVTQVYAGGISRAITSLVDLSPEVEHHLLWAGNEEPASDVPYASVHTMPQ